MNIYIFSSQLSLSISIMDSSDDTEIMDEAFKFKTMKTFANWHEIQQILSKMADGLLNSDQILESLISFKRISYKSKFGNKKQCKICDFEVLMDEYEDQIPTLFSNIAEFVLKNSSNFQYPLIRKGVSYEYTFRKQQILFLLCSMVLCLIPQQQYNINSKYREYCYQQDFSIIFQSSLYKTKAIIQYLKLELINTESHQELLTIKRKSVHKDVKNIIEQLKNVNMCELTIKDDSQNIQDYYGNIKVDFANRYIGGGSLTHGCVQQEIMFANHPELFISHLLCAVMNDNQSMLFIGFKKYNKNTGYSSSTVYAGRQDHKYEYDKDKRAMEYIVAIDALSHERGSPYQYRQSCINREILKAYCGFQFSEQNTKIIVSGNWGCGAFGGNVQLKLMIQWIACSLAGKDIIYCPFGSSKLINDEGLINRIRKLRVGEVYELLIKICRQIRRQMENSINLTKERNSQSIQEVNIFFKMKNMVEGN